MKINIGANPKKKIANTYSDGVLQFLDIRRASSAFFFLILIIVVIKRADLAVIVAAKFNAVYCDVPLCIRLVVCVDFRFDLFYLFGRGFSN